MDNEELFKEFSRLMANAGIDLVELHVTRQRASSSVRAVIYCRTGTGIAECTKAHKLLQSRLQVTSGDQEPSVEVSTPGLDRVIKHEREYGIFTGRGIRLLVLDEGDQWLSGVIASADGVSLTLDLPDGTSKRIEYATIRKAKLDYSQEGEKNHVV